MTESATLSQTLTRSFNESRSTSFSGEVTRSETFGTHSMTNESTGTVSLVQTETATGLSTKTPTATQTLTTTTTFSLSNEETSSPSNSLNSSASNEHFNITLTEGGGRNGSDTKTLIGTETRSIQPSSSDTLSLSQEQSATRTLVATDTATITPPPTASKSKEYTGTMSGASTGTVTATQLLSATDTASLLDSKTLTLSQTESFSSEVSKSITVSRTQSFSSEITGSFNTRSPTLTVVLSGSESGTIHQTASETVTADQTLTRSATFGTPSITVRITDTAGNLSESNSLSSDATSTKSRTRNRQQHNSSSGTVSVSSTITLSSTVTPPPTETGTHVITISPTYTPPPTKSPSRDFTASLSTADTNSRTETADTTATASVTTSSTLTQPVTTTATFTLTETADRTSSPSLSVSLSGSETGGRNYLQGTISQSGTGSESASGSASLTQVATNSPTADGTMTFTLSETHPITVTHSATQSISHPLTDEKSASASESASQSSTGSDSLTNSIQAITAASRYVATPSKYQQTFQIGTKLSLLLLDVPLDINNDVAGLLEYDQSCDTTGNNLGPMNPNMLRMNFTGRPTPGGRTHNWTVTVDRVGRFTICYWSKFVEKWGRITKPGNVTVIPLPTIGALKVNNPYVGQVVSISFPVAGANIATDAVRLLKWGESCNSGFLTFERWLPLTAYDPITKMLTASSSIVVTNAIDYTVCYRGFPNEPTTSWTKMSYVPFRAEVSTTGITYNNVLRAGTTMWVTVAGFGLNYRDKFFITNDTVNRCNVFGGPQIPRRIQWGTVDPVTTTPNQAQVYTKLSFDGPIVLCYRGNTTNRFRYNLVGLNTVESLAPVGFSPNGTAWVARSEMILYVLGPGLDSWYDQLFVAADHNRCTSLTRPAGEGIFPVNFVGHDGGARHDRFTGVVPVPGNFSVCYRSNTTQNPNGVWLGNVEVRPYFYDMTSVFYDGVNVVSHFELSVLGQGLDVTADTIYMIKQNVTQPNNTCNQKVAPRNATFPEQVYAGNNSFRMLTRSSGFHRICYVTKGGKVLQSEALAIFPDAPSGYDPTLIGINTPTTVVFSGSSGMDLTFGDTVYPCANENLAFVPVGPTQAIATMPQLGYHQLCFKAGVRSPLNPLPTVTQLPGFLAVSPIVTLVEITPNRRLIGQPFNVSVSGFELDVNDVLYVCNDSNPVAHLNPNTVDFTVRRVSLREWTITGHTAGSFELCYNYAKNPGFPPGPLGYSLMVDPTVFRYFPLQIKAGVEQDITLTGEEVDRINRVFIDMNGTGCTTLENPFEVNFRRVSDNSTTSAVFRGVVPRRGMFPLCYIGPSGAANEIGTRLTVVPHIRSFSATQTGAIRDGNASHGLIFFSNYPINIELQGGGLDYTLDRIFGVMGSLCSVTEQTLLFNLNPPQGATTVLPLVFLAPQGGEFSLCYVLGGSPPTPTLIPGNMLRVRNGLYFDGNRTLGLEGPYTNPSSVVAFSFTVGPRTATSWTGLATPSTATAIPVEDVPSGVIHFRAVVLDTNGLVQYTLKLRHESLATSAACGRVPAVVNDNDLVRKFAHSMILLHNFVTVRCYGVLVDSNAAMTLMRAVLLLIEENEGLVTDPIWVFQVLSKMVVDQPGALQRYDDMLTLLTTSASTLNRPDSEISTDLLHAHVELVNAIITSLASLSGTPEEDATLGQRVALAALRRFRDVASRFCDVAPAGSLFNSTQAQSSLAAVNTPIDGTLAYELLSGFGVVARPHFAASSAAPVCLMSALTIQNVLPQRAGAAPSSAGALSVGGRRQLGSSTSSPTSTTSSPTSPAPTPLTTAAPDIGVAAPSQIERPPDFNFPSFVFSLPKSTNPSQPFAQTPQIEFQYAVATPTRDPTVPGEGFHLVAEFYRFVPDGSTSGSGEWIRDPDTSGFFDESSSVIVIVHNTSSSANSVNSQNQPITGSNILIISGRFEVVPNVIKPPTHKQDIGLVIFVLVLVVLHAVMCLIGNCADNYRDKKYLPDHEQLLAPQDNITLHRYLSCGTRKPHHPTPTWSRVTTMFTFVFTASIASLVVCVTTPFERTPQYNILLGLAVAVIATPFAAMTRVALLLHLRDWPSGIAAAAAALGFAIGTFSAHVLIGAIIALVVGILFFISGVGYFRSRWSFELQPRPGPFPTIFGMGVHILIEGTAIVYILMTSLVGGTPTAMQDAYQYPQTMLWSVVFDCLLLEVVKSRLLIWLRNFTVSYDEENGDAVPAQPPTSVFAPKTAASAPTESDLDEYEFDAGSADFNFSQAVTPREGSAVSRRGGAASQRTRSALSELDEVGSAGELSDAASVASVEIDDFGDGPLYSAAATPRETSEARTADELSEFGSETSFGHADPAFASPAAGPTAMAYDNRNLRGRSGSVASGFSSVHGNPMETL